MSLSREERQAILSAVAVCIKKYFAQELKPILDKISAIETGKADVKELVSIKAAIANLQRNRGGNDAVQ